MIIETFIKISGMTVCISVPATEHHGDAKTAMAIARRAAEDLEYVMTVGSNNMAHVYSPLVYREEHMRVEAK